MGWCGPAEIEHPLFYVATKTSFVGVAFVLATPSPDFLVFVNQPNRHRLCHTFNAFFENLPAGGSHGVSV